MRYFQRRIKNLKILGYLMQLAPFVRAMILTGSMTTGSVKKRSDIDLLIITVPKRLFIARLFVTILVSLTGIRRKPSEVNPAGKFCLNYYLTSDNPDIKPHTKRCANFHRYIINIWDRGGTYERILRENFWMRNFEVVIRNKKSLQTLQGTFPIKRPNVFLVIQKIKELIFSGGFGDFIEQRLYHWQKKKIVRSALYKSNISTIAVSKNELRLHPKKT